MKFEARTDMADEARSICLEQQCAKDMDGVEAEENKTESGITITRVTVIDEAGEKNIGKPKGSYVTIDMGINRDAEQRVYEDACRVCAAELSALMKNLGQGTVLVIGLGNRNITADAVGPKCVDSVLVTRHLLEYMPEEIDSRLRSVCAIAPGVLGITGIETLEIIKGMVEKVKPSVVIAIDSLCSRHMRRINNTVQMTDTGITPGAGVGNGRKTINSDTLGVPVIAIGVPTVVDAATIAGDTIDLILENLRANAEDNLPLYKMLSVIAEEDKYSMIKQVLCPEYGDFVVTPKEVDSLVGNVAEIVSNAINISLHEGITMHDVDRYK